MPNHNWNFDVEWPQILEAATLRGVDPFAVAAIRVAEDGAAGREFGVLSVPAPDYASQLRVTCSSLRNRLAEYGAGWSEYDGRLIYRKDFIEYFARKWAPSNASNDPTGLNANWIKNFWWAYLGFCDAGDPIKWQAKNPFKD